MSESSGPKLDATQKCIEHLKGIPDPVLRLKTMNLVTGMLREVTASHKLAKWACFWIGVVVALVGVGLIRWAVGP